MAWIAGVDGCKGGWIAVYEDTDSGKLDCHVAVCNRKEEEHADHKLPCAFGVVMDHHSPLAAVAVDMPIGLCNDKEGRACDSAARKVLRPRRSSSIFSAPALGLLREMEPYKLGRVEFYDEAKQVNRKATRRGREQEGAGLTRQTWALAPKIAEVDRFLDARPESRNRVHEAHPEVSFGALNGGSPLPHSKAAFAGLIGRRALLRGVFGFRFEALEAQAAELDSDECAGLDDFYDALACLWTARRIYEGTARTLPEDPPGPGGYIFY